MATKRAAGKPTKSAAKRPPKTNAQTRTDWTAVERDYVEGVVDETDASLVWPSQRMLAAMYEVEPKTVQRHATSGKWLEKRRKFRDDVAAQRRGLRVQQLAGMAAEIELGAVAAAVKAIGVIGKRLDTIAAEQDRPGKRARQPSAQEMLRLGNALRANHRTALDALGTTPLDQTEDEAEARQRDAAHQHLLDGFDEFRTSDEAGAYLKGHADGKADAVRPA